jgi:hypothetical protein
MYHKVIDLNISKVRIGSVEKPLPINEDTGSSPARNKDRKKGKMPYLNNIEQFKSPNLEFV